MCYHKSLQERYDAFMDYYSSSFDSLSDELEEIKERFTIMMEKDDHLKSVAISDEPVIKERLDALSKKGAEPGEYSKDEIKEMKWCLKTLQAFTEDGYKRYYENGFDHLPTPIITAGAPEQFKLFRWGLIPPFMPSREKAFELRINTLNCISEEMYEKNSYRGALENAQRCLIPMTGFYEWRTLDEKKKKKVPYYVSTKQPGISSLAGLYSRWKDKETDQYYYTYTILTTKANHMMEYVHNAKKRMPVIIPREFEKDWLNKNLSKEDVLALCQPFPSESMRANTISNLISDRQADTNVEEVLKLHTYEKIGTDEIVSQL